VIDAFTAAKAREHFMFLGDAIRWNDQENLLSNGLPGRIPEQALGAAIPGADDAVQRLRDDRVVG
jgi:hypothetical protein